MAQTHSHSERFFGVFCAPKNGMHSIAVCIAVCIEQSNGRPPGSKQEGSRSLSHLSAAVRSGPTMLRDQLPFISLISSGVRPALRPAPVPRAIFTRQCELHEEMLSACQQLGLIKSTTSTPMNERIGYFGTHKRAD